ncbi:N-acyl homoserine lactonase family protein [Leucobacter allii]|uniref:N-acyl homoserine lactonase family protein n=1 Tax=Leucobacter allii TaxID=2932247 RepID=A0ABY4FKW6_9MICO|nr:N-acyl homoserine lactonase family protein [Leucobacter allii]UOQ56890.1 N-acyl homoserine lactonase family protein [Leucobacter allii]
MNEAQYEVVIVRYGTRSGHRGEVYLNYSIYGEPDAPIGMDYYVWVIRNAHRTVLVDTGFSPQGAEHRQRTFVRAIPEVYAALGIDLAAEQTLVVTHAHYDHIGNLALFPRAQVHISGAELDFWLSPMGERKQFSHSTEPDEIAALSTAVSEGRVTRVGEGEILAPGIELLEIGGHTPGQLAVKVATDEGTVLLASDAIHYYEEYESDLPFAFVADLPAMYAGFDRIRGLIERGEVDHLVSGHDPDTLQRFTPVADGPLTGIAATIGHASHAHHHEEAEQ